LLTSAASTPSAYVGSEPLFAECSTRVRMARDPVSPRFVSMALTPDLATLEEAEVRRFVRKIYRELFDAHAPVDVFLASLEDDELEMRFPEETVRAHAGFRRWYERIANTF